MPISKFFCAAVEGATTDGRSIERKWIEDMAATYAPKTYTALGNLEHLRGYDPNGTFKIYGDIIAAKAQEVELELGGKKEKRLGLFVQVDATDELVALQKKKQKMFCSAEVNTNFAKTNMAYLQGLAFTDNPASLGTEMMQFAAKAAQNPFANRKTEKDNLFSEAREISLEFEEEKEEAQGLKATIEAFTAAIKNAFTPQNEASKNEAPNPIVQSINISMIEGAFASFTKNLETFNDAQTSKITELSNELTATKTELKELKNKLEASPIKPFTTQNIAQGIDAKNLASC